jgi:hypothetical protein
MSGVQLRRLEYSHYSNHPWARPSKGERTRGVSKAHALAFPLNPFVANLVDDSACCAALLLVSLSAQQALRIWLERCPWPYA